ncbi:MFS transporter [Aestuariivirga sp.]|uniref:MFS transporter n=1 Tax=Aestuariivirga sp. TaxID=2650926 RepID=UPI00391B8B96
MIKPSLWILLLSVGLLCLGHGLSGSLVSLAANQAEFGTDVTGFVMAGYSAGLLVSTFITPRLVRNVGHVRTFAGLASTVSTAVLLFPLWHEPVFWFLLRVVTGLCVSGMFIVCESWLNTTSSNRNRGQMLSLYMIVTYGMLGLGQLLLNVSDESGFVRFILVSCLLSLSLVPLILLPSEAPSVEGAQPVSVEQIWRASPLAVFGVLACGLGQSAFFALGVVFGLAKGLPLVSVSIMMALPPLGVILSQYPIGWISDRFDRRTIILLLSVVAAVIAALTLAGGNYISRFVLISLVTAFGVISLPIYSLVVAHANDHLEKDQVLGASAKLILLYGVGSLVGPILVGDIMRRIGGDGFLIYMIVVHLALALFAFLRMRQRPEHLKAQGKEVMTVSPVSTPAGPPALQE